MTVLITSTLHARPKYISGSGNLGVYFYKNQPRNKIETQRNETKYIETEQNTTK